MSGGILLPGNAAAGNVRGGKTFSSAAGVGVTGTLAPNPSFYSGNVNGNPYNLSYYMIVCTVPISGQPIILCHSVYYDANGGNGRILSISDSFSGHYTWTKLQQEDLGAGGYNPEMEMWLGTGGAGSIGDIQVNINGSGEQMNMNWAVIVPAFADTSANPVDVQTKATGSGSPWTSPSITPSAANEVAIVCFGAFQTNFSFNAGPASPWIATYDRFGNLGFCVAIYVSPPANSAIQASAASQGSTFAGIGVILKAAA